MEPTRWIDVHHHSYHPDLVALMRHHGITHMAPGVPVPDWTVGRSLDTMDRHGIEAAVMSVLMPDAVGRLPDGGAAMARVANELSAELVRERPDRFGALACLPMTSTDQALEEIAYAADVLGADGFVLAASTPDGRYLGDPGLDPVLEELDRRAAVVFIHPNPSARCTCAGGPDLAATVPPPLVDFVMDSTRAVANLLFGGALRRYPGIRFIVAHAGGTVPYLAWRLDLASTWVLAGQAGADDVAGQLRALYYECAQSASPGAVACVRAVTDDSHLLFGTDFPFMNDDVVGATRRGLAGIDGIPGSDVGRHNVLALLPDLAARLGSGVSTRKATPVALP